MQWDDASLRVLRWRVKGLWSRIGQAVLIAALLWLHLRTWTPVIWCGVASLTAAGDALLSRRLLARLEDRALWRLSDASRLISALSFATVSFVMLHDRSAFGLAAPILLACAMALNNAIMTAGAPRFSLTIMTPAAIVLTGLPLAAWATGHALDLTAALVLTVGGVGYAIFIVRLTDAQVREGGALRRALQAAEAASHAKSSFLAVTSHEIRTPLNGVLGMAQAMEADDLSSVQRERVGVIRESGAALLDLLNDILDLSKIEAGKLELDCAPFDLAVVVEGVAAAFGASARAKGLSLDVVLPPDVRGAYAGDAARLRQVLANLVSNAIKFTAEGGVAVHAAATPGGVRLSVTDTGPGVPEAFADRLFDRFTQADTSTTRRFGGAGLGLAICRDLAEAMGGVIRFERPEAGGSRFVVELPLPRIEGLTPGDVPTVEPLAQAERQIRVLAAEDNPVNQLVLRTLLAQFGVDADIVGTGREAVDAWAAGSYDLILMDIQMPDMDGPDAAREIRARESAGRRAPTPIVALTADVMSHQVDAYAAAGMDGCVAKPVAVDDLYGAIARFAVPAAASARRTA